MKKNALLIYTYNNAQSEDGYYNPRYMNIGDYIQSLAARQFFKQIDVYIDRDRLSFYRGSQINLIMNAWYFLWCGNQAFSERFHPLFVSFHINNMQNVTQKTLDYLKKHEPIGCRDYQTRDFLKKHHIEAYFSGCLTLTLGETYRVKESERNNNIYFVNYTFGKNYKIDGAVKKILKKYPDCQLLYRSHHYPLNSDPEGSLREAERLIKDYARAKLVITQNIHCALPCLALGTPVILITPSFDYKRFRGITSLLNCIGENERGKFEIKVLKGAKGLVINSEAYKKYAKHLKKLCLAFTHSKSVHFKGCEHKGTDLSRPDTPLTLPRFHFFKKYKSGSKRHIVLFGFIHIRYKKQIRKQHR